MKLLLAIFLLLLPFAGLSQITASPAAPSGSADALDARNGFRGYRFGAPLSDYPQLQKRGKHYVDHMEIRRVGNAELERLEFYFDKDKRLCSVLLATNGTLATTQLFERLVGDYGPPQTVSDTKWIWAGKRVTMTFSQVMVTANVGYMGVPIKYCVVTIDTNEELARRQAKSGPKELHGTQL